MVDFDKGREERLQATLRTGGRADGGITVRDYLAAKAMQSLVNGYTYLDDDCWSDIAKGSYAVADAMMAERERLHVTVRGQVTVEEAFGLEK
jgi:hypothetical protein